MTEDLTELRRLPPGFDLDDHLARLDVDGFTIVEARRRQGHRWRISRRGGRL